MTEYQGEDRRAHQEQGWHLKKEVNLSMIISIVGIAISVVVGYTDLKREISLIQADTQVIHQKIAQQDSDLDKAISTLQAHYMRMDAKLDRLIERTTK